MPTGSILFTHPLLHRSMMLSVGHIILLEVVNVYCMAPLIWYVMFTKDNIV